MPSNQQGYRHTFELSRECWVNRGVPSDSRSRGADIRTDSREEDEVKSMTIRMISWGSILVLISFLLLRIKMILFDSSRLSRNWEAIFKRCLRRGDWWSFWLAIVSARRSKNHICKVFSLCHFRHALLCNFFLYSYFYLKAHSHWWRLCLFG